MSTDHHDAPTNNQVLSYIRSTLGPIIWDAIYTCALNGYGKTRNINGILSVVAMRFGTRATTAGPLVAAAFGFLRRPSGEYADMLQHNSDDAPDELPELDTNNEQLTAAFALSRAVHNGGGSFLVPAN